MTSRINRLVLSNWRNFRRVDLPLVSRMFVFGPNASGKSNLLDALRFLHDIATPGGSLDNAVKVRRGLKHIRSLHAGRDSRVLLEVEVTANEQVEPWTYTLELSGSAAKEESIRVDRERVLHGARSVLDRETSKEDPLEQQQTHLQQATQSLNFRPLANTLAALSYTHVVPQVARSTSRAEELTRRDAPGSDFIEQIARLPKKQRVRVLRRIERPLKFAVPKFSELDVERDSFGRPHLKARYEHWRKAGGWQNEQEFSDGTLRLIGLLWAIDQGSAPLVLEEPELSLHRDVIRQLPRLFALAASRSGRQILVSTHSEEMLTDKGIDPSEIVILEPSEQETQVALGSEKPELVDAARARRPLGRLVTSLTKPRGIEQLSLPFPERGQ